MSIIIKTKDRFNNVLYIEKEVRSKFHARSIIRRMKACQK